MDQTTKKIMANVMAALNHSGVEYTPNEIGFSAERELKSIISKEEPVEYDGEDGGEFFKRKFEEFAAIPQYSKINVSGWAEINTDEVVIKFTRYYVMTEADRKAYAAFYGCDTFEEACVMCADPETQSKDYNAKIRKEDLHCFLRQYAKYCW